MNDTARLADQAASILSQTKIGAEIYVEDSVLTSAAVAGGRVESLEFKEERGAGVRVFESGRMGFAYTSDLTPEGIRAAADSARAFASHTDPDGSTTLPRPESSSMPDPDTGDVGIGGIEAYRKVAIAKAMEEAARGVDPRVTKIRSARYTDVVGRIEIRSTEGLSLGASYARVYGALEVVAEAGGEAQSGYASDFALKFSALDPFKIGREAARRAVAKIPSAK